MIVEVVHIGTVNKSFVLPPLSKPFRESRNVGSGLPPVANWQKYLFSSTLKEELLLSFGSWFLCSPHFKLPPWQGCYLPCYVLETSVVQQINEHCWSHLKYCNSPPHTHTLPHTPPHTKPISPCTEPISPAFISFPASILQVVPIRRHSSAVWNFWWKSIC